MVVVLLFGLAMVGLLWHMHSLSEDLARRLVLQGAEHQSTVLDEIRKYYSSEVIARLRHVKGVEVSHDYRAKDHAIPLPATLAIELGKNISERAPGFEIRLYSDFPYPWRKEGGPRDVFERDAISWVRQHPDEPYFRYEQVGGVWRLRYAKADRMQASCVACHNSHPASPKRDWREGDVRGVLEVVRPVSESAFFVGGPLQTSLALIGVVGALGLSGLGFATFRIRRSATEMEHLVEKRTAELAIVMERAKQTAQAKAQILSTVHAFFIGIDPQEVVKEWTPAAERVFGISLIDAIGQPFFTLPIEWNWSEVRRGLEQARTTLTQVVLNKVCLKVQGRRDLFVKLTLTVPCSDDGYSVIVMGEDITEHLVLEHDLAQAQKLESIGQLAAGIAHEINTPIQFVGDNVRFLSESFSEIGRVIERYENLLSAGKTGASPREHVEACDAAKAEADLEYLLDEIPKAISQSTEGIDRVATIVRAMKDFAHPDSDDKTCVDLNRTIESTVTVSRNEWKYVADMKTDLAPDLPPVPCLLGQFNQVVLNMIVNAAHAIGDVVKGTGQKGLITIASRRAGEFVEIRIIDTGTGIPEEIRDKIFDPFFTTKEVGKGTGQGLAIARSVIVEKHRGTISVESEVGRGTTFVIRLPLTEPEGAKDMERAA